MPGKENSGVGLRYENIKNNFALTDLEKQIMQQKKDLGIECPKINSEEVEIVEVNECDNNIVDSESSETEEKLVPNRGALITYDGKSQNLSTWCKELGFSHQTLYGRLYIYGWSVEKAFTTKRKEVK